MSEAQSFERDSVTGGFFGPLRHVYYLTDHRIRQQASSYALGFFWWVLDPILNTAILYVVTTLVMNIRSSNLAMFLLTGLVMYRFLQSAITGACNSLSQAMVLSSRLYVPKYKFVVRDFCVEFVDFMIGLAFIIALSIFVGQAHIKPFELFYVLLVATVFALASSSLVSLFNTFVSDVRVVLSYAFRALFFLSGTFFGLDRVPEEWRSLFLANPFALLIHELRVALILPQPLDYLRLSVLLLVSLMFGALGFFLLWKFDRVVPKYAS
jgi:lipopolysaccharide transport system permease protein